MTAVTTPTTVINSPRTDTYSRHLRYRLPTRLNSTRAPKKPASIPFSNSAANFQASSTKFFTGRVITRYVRCRIFTVFSGGTVQALTRFSFVDILPRSKVFPEICPQSGFTYSAVTAASTNAGTVKAAGGNLLEIALSNPTATPAFVKIYDKASAPTVGTDVPVITIPLDANSAKAFEFGAYGKRFANGIAIAVTGAIAATDTTNAVAGVQMHGTYI
jgi:hypothetical protein